MRSTQLKPEQLRCCGYFSAARVEHIRGAVVMIAPADAAGPCCEFRVPSAKLTGTSFGRPLIVINGDLLYPPFR